VGCRILNNEMCVCVCSSVSAPGKALITGGYLVLEKENIGVTVAASARFYSTVTVLVMQSSILTAHILY
jgi:phosphomevalonate kinase